MLAFILCYQKTVNRKNTFFSRNILTLKI